MIISEHLYTELVSWGSTSNTFFFEFDDNLCTRFTFETKQVTFFSMYLLVEFIYSLLFLLPQGAIIASNIQSYFEVLINILKNSYFEEADVEDDESGTTIFLEDDDVGAD